MLEAVESYEVLRDSGGWEVAGGLIVGLFDPASDDLSEALSKGLSLKLKRLLPLVLGAGLNIAGDIRLRKSK